MKGGRQRKPRAINDAAAKSIRSKGASSLSGQAKARQYFPDSFHRQFALGSLTTPVVALVGIQVVLQVIPVAVHADVVYWFRDVQDSGETAAV
jgi:hypothetical protein